MILLYLYGGGEDSRTQPALDKTIGNNIEDSIKQPATDRTIGNNIEDSRTQLAADRTTELTAD